MNIQAPFQIKRGTLSNLHNYVPAVGEPLYSTSTKQLFIGDGITAGGNLVSGGGAGNYDFGSITSPNNINLDFGGI